MLGDHGLRTVSTDELKKVLKYVHNGTLACPLEVPALACVGLQHRSEVLLGALRGLDARSVRAVVVCVLAERT